MVTKSDTPKETKSVLLSLNAAHYSSLQKKICLIITTAVLERNGSLAETYKLKEL
jgi:hypothetical protein